MNKKIIRNNLNDQLIHLRNQGKKIVFTNGCFDILHVGHIHLLRESKKLGDILIVGLNSDSSVKKIKGKNRPVINQVDRAKLLGAIRYVDFVVVFEEETPLTLIQKIKPHILIKGSDYDLKMIVGCDDVLKNGGEVKTIELLEGYSSSNYMNNFKN